METDGRGPAKLHSLLPTAKDSSRGAFLKKKAKMNSGRGGKKENRDEERFIHQASRGDI